MYHVFLPYGQNKLHLSSILDVYNGEVIDLEISRTETLFYTHLISCQHV
ncbi:hypothetical protein BSNT_10210 [Bacillus subtilis subsp. natto BEST195]|nr:hypothetical protein BSNT_10210 [Bacillus subtilis subsp. natto BEST195]